MMDIGIEPRLDPPEPLMEHCSICGEPAMYADISGSYCEDCAMWLSHLKYARMSNDEKAEFAGLERIL